MHNFGKKIIWISFIVFLIFGSIAWWQTNCPAWQVYDTTINACVIPEVTVTWVNCKWGKIVNWICKCPEGTTRVAEKWCLACSDPWVCCGIQLNTSIPFIWDCIEFGKKESTESQSTEEMVITQEEAFPTLMGYLIKILFTIILLWSFIAILTGGVMISAAWADEQRAAKGKKLIINVIVALAILGTSGVILRLINPNFFQ